MTANSPTARVKTLGPYTAGEVPEGAWRHDFDDGNGNALDLTGFAAKVSYRIDGGTQVVRDAEIVSPATDGRAEYAWIAADMATAGLMQGEMWVGMADGSIPPIAQPFRMTIDEPLGGPAPEFP